MKGKKSESKGNDQHHFMDDGNKAESLSVLLSVSEARGMRAAGPPGGLQGSGGAQQPVALPSVPCPCSWRVLLCPCQLCWKQLTERGQHKDLACNSNRSGKNSCLHLVPRREGLILTTSEPAADRPKLSRMISPRVCQNSQTETYSLWKRLFPAQLFWDAFLARACWLLTLTEAAWSNTSCTFPTEPHAIQNFPQVWYCFPETPKGNLYLRHLRAMYRYLSTRNSLFKFVFSKHSNFSAQIFPSPLNSLFFFIPQKIIFIYEE